MADDPSRSSPDSKSPDARRLEAVEESCAFLDHRFDQLDQVTRDFGTALDRLARRLDRLEAAFAQSRTAQEEPQGGDDILDNVPPHAAHAPYDKPSIDPTVRGHGAGDGSDQQ